MFILNHIVEESISKMEKDHSLVKIITCDDFISISVRKIVSSNLYNVIIQTYADAYKEV